MDAAETRVDELLTTKDVAERWHISTKTVARMVARGVLRSVRLSARCIRFRTSDVASALTLMTGEPSRALGESS